MFIEYLMCVPGPILGIEDVKANKNIKPLPAWGLYQGLANYGLKWLWKLNRKIICHNTWELYKIHISLSKDICSFIYILPRTIFELQ